MVEFFYDKDLFKKADIQKKGIIAFIFKFKRKSALGQQHSNISMVMFSHMVLVILKSAIFGLLT